MSNPYPDFDYFTLDIRLLLMEILAKIKDLISKDETEKSIQELSLVIKDYYPSLEDKIILLERRYLEGRRNIVNGTVSHNEASLHSAQINEALLILLKEIETSSSITKNVKIKNIEEYSSFEIKTLGLIHLIRNKLRVRRSRLRLYLALLVLFLVFYNYTFLYVAAKTLMSPDKVVIIDNEKTIRPLNALIQYTESQIMNTFSKKRPNASWEAAQCYLALFGLGSSFTERHFREMLENGKETNPPGWSQLAGKYHFGNTSWVLFSQAATGQKIDTNVVAFVLSQQNTNGSWSIIPNIENTFDKENYNSLYATCWASLALNKIKTNSLQKGDSLAQRIDLALKSASYWIVKSKTTSGYPLWRDYPNNTEQGQTLVSISALAIHTINALNPEIAAGLNKKWIDYLSSNRQTFERTFDNTSIDYTRLDNAQVFFQDGTSHIIFPWHIISIFDAYKDASFLNKVFINIQLNEIIQNLDLEEPNIKSNEWVKAEYLIGLRYVLDSKFRNVVY